MQDPLDTAVQWWRGQVIGDDNAATAA